MVKKFLSSAAFAGPSPHLDVVAWGATGDGSTNDTAAISAAVTEAEQTGGRVFLPPGTYRVDLGALVDLSNVELFGVGDASVVKPVAGSTGSMLRLSNGNYLHDFRIDGDAGSAAVEFAVFVLDGARNRIERLRIANLTGTAIFFAGNCADLDVTDCRCEDYAVSGINGEFNSSLDRFRFTGNHCSTSTGNPDISSGIGVRNGSRGAIVGNYVDGQGTSPATAHHLNGITIGACSSVSLMHNRSRRNKDDGITLYDACNSITIMGNVLSDSTQTAGIYLAPSGTHRRITISGNVCTNNGSASTNGFGIDIDARLEDSVIQGNVCSGNVFGIMNPDSAEAHNATNVSIVGNQVTDNLRAGISLSGGSRYRIIGNSCKRNGQGMTGQESSGILLNGVSESLIHGNYLEDDQATATQTYGLRLLNSHRNEVSGNYATGNQFTGFFVVDADHNLLHGNYSSGNSQATHSNYHGIHVYAQSAGKSQYNTVTGNTVRRGTGPKQQRWGIIVQADNNVISNNDVFEGGTSGTGLFNGGAGNQVRQNRGHNPQGIAAITVGASPFTYTCGDTPEAVYIRGGQVSSIRRGSATIFDTTPATVWLEPGESVTVTYSKAPTMNKDRK